MGNGLSARSFNHYGAVRCHEQAKVVSLRPKLVTKLNEILIKLYPY